MVFKFNEGLGLLELANIVLSLINPSPCYVKNRQHHNFSNITMEFQPKIMFENADIGYSKRTFIKSGCPIFLKLHNCTDSNVNLLICVMLVSEYLFFA